MDATRAHKMSHQWKLRTLPEHLFRDIVELALELVEELIDSRGELALGIRVLQRISQ